MNKKYIGDYGVQFSRENNIGRSWMYHRTDMIINPWEFNIYPTFAQYLVSMMRAYNQEVIFHGSLSSLHPRRYWNLNT